MREVEIGRASGGIYLIRFENGVGIQVKEHRLYRTKEEAIVAMPHKADKNILRKRTPYDYI